MLLARLNKCIYVCFSKYRIRRRTLLSFVFVPSQQKTIALDMNATDDAFGPRLEGTFDFTLVFEQSIFSILPSAVFLGLIPARFIRLCGHEIRARAGALLWAKMVTRPPFLMIST
jgi:hypothetical protein